MTDDAYANGMLRHEIKFQVVLTKCDLVVRSILARRYDMVEEVKLHKASLLEISAFAISAV